MIGDFIVRTILLSLREDVYKKVLSGEKIYEHRKVFSDEHVKAYIYVSSPMKSICGIMYLSNIIRHLYLNGEKNLKMIPNVSRELMNICQSINLLWKENTNAIPLSKLRDDLTKFIVHQMYYFIENSELLEYLEKNLIPDGVLVTHTY